MDKKYKGEKRVFEKHKQRLYENGKEIYAIFQDKSFGEKKRPLRKAWGQKKSFWKNISKGYKKKSSAKGMKKKSLKVISGHDGHLLHPKGMADAPP